MKLQIIFSHGMGLRSDNRGLFPFFEENIRKQFANVEFYYFDYNDIEGKQIYVKSFSKQAEILQSQIDSISKNSNDSRVVIIGQSQGSLIPAFCNVSSIYKVIGISPFFHTKIEDVLSRYGKNEKNKIDFSKTTKRYRSDGSVSIIPSLYWKERFDSKPEQLYNQMANSTKLTLICPLQDEIMDITNLNKIKNTRIINLDGDHDFSGEHRNVLLKYVLEELSY